METDHKLTKKKNNCGPVIHILYKMCDWKTCDVTPLPAETRPNQLLCVLPRRSTYNIPISFLSFFTFVTYLSER